MNVEYSIGRKFLSAAMSEDGLQGTDRYQEAHRAVLLGCLPSI